MTAILLAFAALATVAGAGVTWFRAASGVRLPENRSGFVAVFAAGAVLAGAALFLGSGWVVGVPSWIALVGGSIFLFTVSISRQKLAEDAIVVGATLPDFSALDGDGVRFESASLAGRPVLLKFFRGHW